MTEHFKQGDEVQHSSLGIGKVCKDTDGSGAITVRFEAGVWSGPLTDVKSPSASISDIRVA
jgi:hypothetical protein